LLLNCRFIQVLSVLFLLLVLLLGMPSTALAKKVRRSAPSAIEQLAATESLDSVSNKSSRKRSRLVASAIADQDLSEIYQSMAQGHSLKALSKLEALIQLAPHYKLLHMLRADLLVILSQKQTMRTVNGSAAVLPTLNNEQNNRFRELREEAQLRMIGQATLDKVAKNELLPKNLLRLADNEPYAIVVDGKSSRLYLYQNQVGGTPKLLKDFYVTQGKLGMKKTKEGDNRTPVGAYFTHGRMPGGLADFYGAGALPLDYPNVWDKALGRTGHGIWLHGTPAETYARAPYASEGCVVLPNPDIGFLLNLPITSALPVVLTDAIEWVTVNSVQEQQKIALSLLEQWNRFASNTGLTINFPSLVLIDYPGEANMLLTRFQYTSANGALHNKQIFWKKTGASWSIVLDV
jgi:hypothetical protein